VRGSPLLRALLLLAALLALSVPLRRVTQPSPGGGVQFTAAEPSDKPTGVAAQTVALTLSLTRPAERIELQHLGKPVWSKDRPGLRETMDLSLPFPPEGIELAVTVRWQGAELSAMRLQLTTPDGTDLERSVWGQETVEAVLSFP
jgi:hypothetical protein